MKVDGDEEVEEVDGEASVGAIRRKVQSASVGKITKEEHHHHHRGVRTCVQVHN
jgi:hypothetical protein